MEEVDLVAEAQLSTRNATKLLRKSHDLYLRKMRGGVIKSRGRHHLDPRSTKKSEFDTPSARFLGRFAAQKPRLRRIT